MGPAAAAGAWEPRLAIRGSVLLRSSSFLSLLPFGGMGLEGMLERAPSPPGSCNCCRKMDQRSYKNERERHVAIYVWHKRRRKFWP
jgi:hypothetical protein